MLDVSVIVTIKNEEESIPVLARELEAAFKDSPWSWECLWVDDGSSDSSLSIMKDLHQKSAAHQFITLDKNYGQSAALAAGFRHARGRIFATLDGDLQNDPADFPAIIKQLEAGDADLVNGIRAKRQDSIIRKLSSKIANGVRNWITGESVTDVGCAIRAYYAYCVTDIPVFKGMHRFFPTLLKMQGFRAEEVPVNHRPREFGQTKYGINNRLWVGIVDLFAVRWMQHRMVKAQVARGSKDIQHKESQVV